MSICTNCGQKIPKGAKFCSNCGAPAGKEKKAAVADKEKELLKGQRISENIYLCPDGAYRWIYEFDMVKNPVLLFTVWRVMAMTFAIVMIFVCGLTLIEGGYDDLMDMLGHMAGFGILLLVMMGIGVIAYLIVAQSYGWKYMVLFTMDEKGVEHRQMKSQFDKARAMGWLTAAAGLATGRVSAAGAGALAATRDSSISVFEYVKKVKAVRFSNVIYVNQMLFHNQVYTSREDFDFVRDYIMKHCRNAKCIG
ncbi:zinc-ribbon domain-containing protein [Oribacterium sp. WCC10]|uniref:zinc-ribbon domain-containing protein n=1 Tax=Oribacterium sp. WCC10 TaxID=1855343 RepID=UPI0008F29689|nr:zinc ribbon domain-containing protein [Oribacterium sp. WCC10]SFG06641.1 zinc-ribbon domain-containing protein [Oribacterium sp. WCC10]